MSNAAHLLPGRLRAAATGLLNARRNLAGLRSDPDVLEGLSETEFIQAVEETRAALGSADAVDPAIEPLANDERGAARIRLAATVGLDLRAQAVVLLDVAADGTVGVSTWARGAGTPSEAIAEWARGLEAHAITVVPFQTVFGWGCGGRPTPLTPEQRATLSEAGRAYADRNTEVQP